MENATNDNQVSLYEALKATGLEITNHESDLYVHVTEETTAILERYPLQKKNAKSFVSRVDGKRTYDVPFAYDPFWDKKPNEDARSSSPKFK